MKKLYILTAVIALLTLSLNAQNSQYAVKNVAQRVDKSIDADKAVSKKAHDLSSGAKDAPADAVSVPYYNHMTTDDEFNQLGTYDANGDGQSGSNNGVWGFFYTDNTQTDVIARYTYHSRNAANDYLFIAVPVTLHAGVHYRFSMDVRANGLNEMFEVVMFDELTTASIESGIQIIPVTQYSSTSTTRIQSEPFTVNEESYMYFAVHCVSAADMYYLYVDNIAIEAEDSDDLSIAISAPESVYAGETATVTATVTNIGSDAVQGYTVNITANGNIIFTQQVNSSLAVGASATYNAQYATTSANAGQNVNFGVEVVYTDDDASNNTAAASMYILPTPPPENVAATTDGNNATMTWSAPNNVLVPGTLIWDFEEQTDLTDFTTIDSDGDGYNWSWHYNTGSGNYTVHTGNGVAYSESYDNDAGTALNPNNWMISPEVNLGGTLTFWAAHQSTYPENFAVYICQGSYSGVSDFVKISPDITTTAAMQKYTYDLSQYSGTGYFAIRHYSSYDNFILLIDDIALETMVPGEPPVSYNIYLDGQLVGNVNANTFSYTFNNVDGEHESAVSAVYPGGHESVAVPVTFTTIPKTDAPTITAADNGDGTYTITATSIDPTATVTLTVGNEQPVTGTGSASYIIAQGNSAQTVTATATAQAPNELVSDPATENITIPALPKTATPVITYQVVGSNMVITATGNGTVTLNVTGGYSATGEGSASVTIPLGLDEQTVTATATAIEPLHQMSDPATQQITIPEAGRSPQPTISFNDNGDGIYTITVNGTGEVAVYIDDADHAGAPIATADGSFSFNVEQHSQAMTITVTATNQEEGLAVSRPVTETYNIPAMTIDSEFHELDPQPANASTPIDMKSLMFVDRFSKVIPNENNHPWLYDYYLQETQVRQRTSNSVEVPVKHTGSDGLGFYSLNQIDNDTIRTLKMDVRNAATDIPLEADSKVYYYTVQRSTAAYPDQADRKWLGVLQRTSDGYYYENLSTAYDYGHEPYPGGQHHVHLDTDTIQGEYNQYLMYVPIVWTMGFDRVRYEIDHVHNSYGAPKWKTGVGDVTLTEVDVERQINSASTTWNDNGQTSIYMMTLNATGKMPTVNTMPYEPYMFRVFVESKNGKLRNWKYIPEDTVNNIPSHFEAAPGTTTGPLCVWSEYVKDSLNVSFNDAMNEINFVKTKVDERDPETGAWTVPGTMNILFAALDDMTTEGEGDDELIIDDDLKIYVRFYYIVKGSADGHIPVVHGQRPRGSADDPAGYGTESPGTPPSPATGLKEVTYPGDVVSVTYYNVQGMSSDRPFDGINIVVTRYSNGSTRTAKVVK